MERSTLLSWLEAKLILIFKAKKIPHIGNHQPISLINTDYKNLYKDISFQTESLYSSISKYRSGFIPKKFIEDTVKKVMILLFHAKKNKKLTLIILDLYKAFDSVN